MKTLVIIPGSDTYHDAVFILVNPENGEVVNNHLCSGSYHAKEDLKRGLREEYKDYELKFIDETDYDVNKLIEINHKNFRE